ncbi:MAG: ATP-binding protein [Gemmatimonadaceae bacterium]|nr:ATP-binding protein [Gemmatimonadaceae bacterium]
MSAAFQMMIGSAPGEVAAVLDAFACFATPNRMPDAMRRDLLVVLDELLANVVMHGVGTQPNGQASVTVQLLPDAVTVAVADNGPPFDPLARAQPDTTLSVDERPIGGLGIYLVQRLVDDVQYARDAHHNVLTLTKRLPDGWSPDSEGAS